jgi:hypothetical protein
MKFVAFAKDAQGLDRRLVPVLVRQCEPPGLLKSIVYISLVGQDENAAQEFLLKGISAKRAKPTPRPSFPGVMSGRPHKVFPGSASPGDAGLAPYIPNLKRSPTDAERRRFGRQVFEMIKARFQTALDHLAQQHEDAVECDFQPNNRDRQIQLPSEQPISTWRRAVMGSRHSPPLLRAAT